MMEPVLMLWVSALVNFLLITAACLLAGAA